VRVPLLRRLRRRVAVGRSEAPAPVIDLLGRIGLVGYGVVHLLVAWAALQVAMGEKKVSADAQGAVGTIARTQSEQLRWPPARRACSRSRRGSMVALAVLVLRYLWGRGAGAGNCRGVDPEYSNGQRTVERLHGIFPCRPARFTGSGPRAGADTEELVAAAPSPAGCSASQNGQVRSSAIECQERPLSLPCWQSVRPLIDGLADLPSRTWDQESAAGQRRPPGLHRSGRGRCVGHPGRIIMRCGDRLVDHQQPGGSCSAAMALVAEEPARR
jgi:Domain of Unknown Function (DUF1206)